MPWKETDVYEERAKFVFATLQKDWTMTELCRAFGISRKTGYKILNRFQKKGMEGLRDQSRAPNTHPNKTCKKIEQILIAERKKRPRWGPRKLLRLLESRHPDIDFPAISTAGDILKRHGLVKARKRRRTLIPKTQPFLHVSKPNDVWCGDYKGWFRTKDGMRCEPLTIMDCHSRYLLTCQGCPSTQLDLAFKYFERAFRKYGLPSAIRTDNGGPFASPGLAGLSLLSVWWIKLGIIPERIDPGRPDQNGRHERMHLTLKQETAIPPEQTMSHQQRAFNRFVKEYNHIRPHESLEDKTPAQCYEKSLRSYPKALPEFEYERHLDVGVVDSMGGVKWRGTSVNLSPFLQGERIGFEQVTERRWKVYLGPMEIALLDGPTAEVLRYSKCILRREGEKT